MELSAAQKGQLLYQKWLRGELKAEGLEAKARIILGWDAGEAEALTADEREEMTRLIGRESEDYTREDCPAMTDQELSEAWIAAMMDYVQTMY